MNVPVIVSNSKISAVAAEDITEISKMNYCDYFVKLRTMSEESSQRQSINCVLNNQTWTNVTFYSDQFLICKNSKTSVKMYMMSFLKTHINDVFIFDWYDNDDFE